MPTRGKKIATLCAALALAVLGVAVWLSWPHLRFWWLFEPLGNNAQGLPEYRHRATGIVMVRVPDGKFWMGAQREDPNGPNYDPDAEDAEGPVHEVALGPFLVGKYEVTQAEWQGVMGDNPSHFKGADLPVEQVSWDECQEFCRRAGLQLPTEAQWEYVCRAGSDAPYCFGADARLFPKYARFRFGAESKVLQEYAWYAGNSYGQTHPVGQKLPNGFGLHDVHGNVGEFCEDVLDLEFYARAEAQGKDPVCRSGIDARVVRGGTWSSGWDVLTSWSRGMGVYGEMGDNVGFRSAFYYPLP